MLSQVIYIKGNNLQRLNFFLVKQDLVDQK